MKHKCVGLVCALLMVNPIFACEQLQHEDSVYLAHSTVNDATIVLHVKNKLKADPQLCNSNVTITAVNGVVCISGKVEYDIQAEKIVAAAQSVRGVKDVEVCDLQIGKSKMSMRCMLNDDYITAKVEGALIRENLYNMSAFEGVLVKTENGVVYLTGCVKNPVRAHNIVKLTESIPDVVKVISAIKIGQ